MATSFIFKGTVANAATQYVPLMIKRGCIGCQIAWLDATSAATITLELTDYDSIDAPLTEAGSAWEWKDSGVSITGPAGAAAGSSLVNVENVRQKRARLKIVATANCSFEILDGAIDGVSVG